MTSIRQHQRVDEMDRVSKFIIAFSIVLALVIVTVNVTRYYAHGGGVITGSGIQHGGGASSGAGTSHHLLGTPTQAQCRAESEWRDADRVVCLRAR